MIRINQGKSGVFRWAALVLLGLYVCSFAHGLGGAHAHDHDHDHEHDAGHETERCAACHFANSPALTAPSANLGSVPDGISHQPVALPDPLPSRFAFQIPALRGPPCSSNTY